MEQLLEIKELVKFAGGSVYGKKKSGNKIFRGSITQESSTS